LGLRTPYPVQGRRVSERSGGLEAKAQARSQFAPDDAGLEKALALDLSAIREVSHVLIERADGNLLVWIALDNPVRDVRERVFQKELRLIENFPEIEFDFNLVPAVGSSDPGQIASGAKVIYTRREDRLAKPR